jgi:SPP1 gp7 family putative phage head morphogenesis protein
MGLGEVIGATMALRRAAASLGASQRVFDGSRLQRERVALLTFASQPPQLIVPRVTFEEALQDMVDRAPVTLKDAAERTSARIGQLYSEGKVAAFVRAAEEHVTEKAQSIISKAIREGIPEFEVGKMLADNVNGIREASEEWSDSYSRMAFRTNLNTATTAGRFRQVQDPDIREVIPALMFVSSNDADTRPNHLAAHGIIMTEGNPSWNQVVPPLGYQCRCTVDFVSIEELEQLGRIRPNGTIIEDKIPPGAGPDKGFVHAGRPDKAIAAI